MAVRPAVAATGSRREETAPRHVVLAFCVLWAANALAAQPTAGRSVSELLRGLASDNLQFLYSSQLVPDSLRVRDEPHAQDPLGIAREALQPHGLALRQMGPNLYVVVRANHDPVREPIKGRAPDVAVGELALTEVVVSASRYRLSNLTSDGSFRLAGADLAAQPSLADDTIRALGRLPGVVQSALSAKSNVRGGETDEVLILFDGFPLRQAFHLAGYLSPFSVINEEAVDDVEVFTGGFPVRYGDHMSGVFDIGARGPLETPRNSYGISFFNAHLRTGGTLPIPDTDGTVAARVGTLQPLLDTFARDVGQPTYSDVYSSVVHKLSPDLEVSASGLWSRDGLSITEEGREDARADGSATYAWLRTDYKPDERLRATLWLGNSRIHSQRDGAATNPDLALGTLHDDRVADFWDARALVDWQWRADHVLEAGFEWVTSKADYNYQSEVSFAPAIAELFGRPAEMSRALQISPTQDHGALFLSDRWRLGERWVTELGGRVERLPADAHTDEWAFDPRMSVLWAATERTSLRLHWGRFHQIDDVMQVGVEDGGVDFPRVQSSEHLIVGVEHLFENGLGARLEAYRKLQSPPGVRYENLLNTMALLPELAADRVRLTPQTAEIRGVELSFAFEREAWNAWLATSLASVTEETDNVETPRSWDQQYAASAGLDWKRGPWRLGALAQYHSGWPTTAVITDADGTLHLGPRDDKRLPDYFSLGLRAEYRRPLRLGNLAIAFELINATNRANICCQEFDVDVDEAGNSTIDVDQRKWMPVIPSLSVEWEF